MVIVFWIAILYFIYMIFATGFELLGLAVGTEGLGGIIAFWLGAGILYVVGSAIGAF